MGLHMKKPPTAIVGGFYLGTCLKVLVFISFA